MSDNECGPDYICERILCDVPFRASARNARALILALSRTQELLEYKTLSSVCRGLRMAAQVTNAQLDFCQQLARAELALMAKVGELVDVMYPAAEAVDR